MEFGIVGGASTAENRRKGNKKIRKRRKSCNGIPYQTRDVADDAVVAHPRGERVRRTPIPSTGDGVPAAGTIRFHARRIPRVAPGTFGGGDARRGSAGPERAGVRVPWDDKLRLLDVKDVLATVEELTDEDAH